MYTFTHVCVSGRVSYVTLDIIYCFTVLPAIIAAISVAAKHNLYRIPASYDKGHPEYHKIRAYVNEFSYQHFSIKHILYFNAHTFSALIITDAGFQ